MKRVRTYYDLNGRGHSLSGLGAEELRLLNDLVRKAEARPDSGAYANYWLARVHNFYTARGLSRPQIVKTIPFLVGADQEGRLMLAAGEAAFGDYRDDLLELIQTRFKNRKQFCKATGISEDMLSHVLNGRKHLAIDTLSRALEKIDYQLQIVPVRNKAS